MKKIYYTSNNRDDFYAYLKKIRETSIKSVLLQESFYDTTIFIMKGGKVIRYIEDTDYGVPYSLEIEQ